MPSKPPRVNFTPTTGPAQGYSVVWTDNCYQKHLTEHGHHRDELSNAEFLDRRIEDAVTSPDAVFPSTEYDPATGGFRIRQRQFVFYKEDVDRRFLLNGQEVRYYVKVAVVVTGYIKKTVEIMSAFYTVRMPDQQRCQPINRI